MKKVIIGTGLLIAYAFAGDIKNGEKIYKSTCSNCHSIHMTGGLGRDFNLVSYNRTKEQIILQISDPAIGAFALGYTANAMPKFDLTKQQIEDVASFIDSLQPIKSKTLGK